MLSCGDISVHGCIVKASFRVIGFGREPYKFWYWLGINGDEDAAIMWFEVLPENCPPNKSVNPNGETYYRLAESPEIKCSDFWSHRKLWPKKLFKVPECRACSVSVFSEIDACTDLRKLKIHQGKPVVAIILNNDSGKVQQTGNNIFHYSWWRALNFDPLLSSRLVK